MTVGFHSPLPPVASGVADYSAALLAELRKRGEIAIASDGCDVSLYHIGNNQLHREIYRRALQRPGVVVLHDAVLQHLFLGSLDRDAYIEEFVYNYGEWHRELAGELWAARARSGAMEEYFRYPMLKRIAEVSRAVVVHNPAAVRIVRRHAPAARICEIPHLLLPVHADTVEVERQRAAWGVAGGYCVFSVFGFLRETKRLPAILKAFDEVHREDSKTALLVAGRFVSSDLERAVTDRLGADGVRYEPWTAAERFAVLCAAADVCLNLRYPGAGETSGIAIRMMGLAKPVVLSDGEESSCFPAHACVRVSHGVSEHDELVEYMQVLSRSRDVARRIGAAAAEYVNTRHAPETVASAYWDLLCDCRN